MSSSDLEDAQSTTSNEAAKLRMCDVIINVANRRCFPIVDARRRRFKTLKGLKLVVEGSIGTMVILNTPY